MSAESSRRPTSPNPDTTFAQAFNRAPLYLAITSLETGKFVAVNDAFEEATGYRREEALGKTPAELDLWVDPEVRAKGYGLLEKQGQVSKTEARFRTKGGEVRTFLISAELTEFEGKWCVLNAAVDITERKDAEAAHLESETRLKQLNETLEERVASRTRQVHALAAQLTLAEATERARLAQVLHDELQQQLYTLQFSLRDAAKAAGDNPDVIAALEETNTRLKEALHISRTTTANLSPPVLQGEGLVEALRWLGSDMQARYDLAVTLEAPPDLTLPSEAVRVLLFNLVRELLFNVVKHAGVDKTTVSLAEDDEQLAITVSDLGKGFDLDTLDAPGQGSGLGLSGVSKRLELFGGHLKVTSTRGEGTEVTIVLPCSALILG